jgi:putative addiction module component (TIGR02574 family)
MSPTVQSLGLDRLTFQERLALVHDLWDNIARELEGEPLTEEQKREVDSRLAAHQANPGAAIPWDQVEAEALARHRP